MNGFISTPSKKPAEHHGMAEKKPYRYQTLNIVGAENCRRKLFSDE